MMKTPFLTLLLSLATTLTSLGMYIEADLKDVPLKRLLANVEKQVKTDPDNPLLWHHLARTHAMAYSRKLADSDSVQMFTGYKTGKPLAKKKPRQPWFGYEPGFVPFAKVTDSGDETSRATAKQHLEKAIEAFRKARTLEPENNTVRLGLAWCLDQAGQDQEALKEYRAILDDAWEISKDAPHQFGNALYAETVNYIVPLLDPRKDAKEIALLKKRRDGYNSLPRPITPIIVPVGGRPTSLTRLIDPQARVPFDLDGTGQKHHWQWITPDAAWLVYDPNRTGHITSATQMFGSRSFLLFCQDGYEALSLLDDNADSTLTGHELDGLALWRDTDSDGLSHPHEVLPIQDYGIVSLSTKPSPHPTGILYSPAGATFTGGATRPTYDIVLRPAQ